MSAFQSLRLLRLPRSEGFLSSYSLKTNICDVNRSRNDGKNPVATQSRSSLQRALIDRAIPAKEVALFYNNQKHGLPPRLSNRLPAFLPSDDLSSSLSLFVQLRNRERKRDTGRQSHMHRSIGPLDPQPSLVAAALSSIYSFIHSLCLSKTALLFTRFTTSPSSFFAKAGSPMACMQHFCIHVRSPTYSTCLLSLTPHPPANASLNHPL
mmetsp:Transcript_16283/g.33020  ORF Transcript_16283/g.33020 Transcript_16283/m.33020 type:complete len:209 (+) Transcript_16283:693-1319(+)